MRELKVSLWGRYTSWVDRHHVMALLMIGILVIGVAGTTTAMVVYRAPQPMPTPTTMPIAKKVPSPSPAQKFYSPLTGEIVPDQASTQMAVTGVMIENSPDARPQSGLKTAGVIYEAIAEGGITRFLALYQQEKPQLVGPVRSLRLYDIDWFMPFQASIAHVGGSQFALREVRNGNYHDIDQFMYGNYYWRATDRPAPHNVYTSFEKLDALNQKRGYATSTFTPWLRQDGAPAKLVAVNDVSVHISSAQYDLHYVYDAAANTYTRYEGGKPHLDREGGNITPAVVIVMDVTETTVMQDGYREQITTVGSGPAHIFQNGTELEATWAKTDRGSQIKFTDASAKEVALNRGQTWITAVPANKGGKVTWKLAK